MKVIVFGATGSIGRVTVEEMLNEGHEVTAFARNPGKLEIDHERLSLTKGDALAVQDVARAIEGHDAVVVALGACMSQTNRIRSEGTLNVIRGMQASGVKRLVVQSTIGAHESWSNLNFFWKRIMFGILLKHALKDHELQEMMVRASGLDWTIVRPSAFTDGPATGTFREDVAPSEHKLALKIPRLDIAKFLTRQLSEATYRHRAVGITN